MTTDIHTVTNRASLSADHIEMVVYTKFLLDENILNQAKLE